MKQRIVAILTALCLALSLLPATALALEQEGGLPETPPTEESAAQTQGSTPTQTPGETPGE